jgi:hypothetical protein
MQVITETHSQKDGPLASLKEWKKAAATSQTQNSLATLSTRYSKVNASSGHGLSNSLGSVYNMMNFVKVPEYSNVNLYTERKPKVSLDADPFSINNLNERFFP